jgi:hypothetical protein
MSTKSSFSGSNVVENCKLQNRQNVHIEQVLEEAYIQGLHLPRFPSIMVKTITPANVYILQPLKD